MRIFKRVFAIVLICVLFISLFASCGDSDEEEKSAHIESIFNQIDIESDSESDSESESQMAASEHVYVLIPKDCSSQLASRALDLVEKLREKTGLLVDLKYDNEYSSFPQGTCEVLIGHTNRLGSENALEMLKTGEYVCRWDTGSLVLCGGSEEATLEAVDLFIRNILPKSTRYSIMAENDGFKFIEGESEDSAEGNAEGESSVESESNTEETQPKRSTFNGYVIDEFLIVYNAENEHSEREMAEMLSALISERSGYLLYVCSSDAINSHTGKTISVICDKNAAPCIESTERNIVIKGSNRYNLSLAVAEFVERMDSATDDGIITLVCDERIKVAKETFNFSLTTYFMKKSNELYSLADMLDAICTGKDVYALVDIDENIEQRLALNMPKDYQAYKIEAFSRKLVLIYNSNTVSTLTSSFDDDARVVDVKIDFVCGETVNSSYYLASEADVEKIDRRGVYFFENGTAGANIPSSSVLMQGEASLEATNISYKMAAGDTFYRYSYGTEVNNTEYKLELSVRLATDICYRLLALTDSLK